MYTYIYVYIYICICTYMYTCCLILYGNAYHVYCVAYTCINAYTAQEWRNRTPNATN